MRKRQRYGAPKLSFDSLVSRVDEIRPAIPTQGLSIPAFEALALTDVAPDRIHEAVQGLHNRRAIYLRRNRFDARVYATRPAHIAGALRRLDPVDAFLAAAIPHLRWLTEALATKDAAKSRSDLLAAREATHDADSAASRVVKAARSHAGRGMNIESARQAMWRLFPAEVMQALTVFEPSFEPGTEASWNSVTSPKPRRIQNGLSVDGKILERLRRADAGMTKTEIMRAIRPKLASAALDGILASLVADRLVEQRSALPHDRRLGKRFFVIATE